ncbi:MAG: outer membrane beta-barrel protein [Saprospiraceae bacterium]|nr:outer membrane beta-barrel protein [Saprospiraceae bacterium]
MEFEYALGDNLITNIYFSYTDDDFEQVTLLDAETTIQQIIPKNFIINRTIGLNQTVIVSPTDWWDINASADVYYSNTTAKIPQTLQFLSGWSAEFDVSCDLILNKRKTVFATLNYLYITRGVDNLDVNSSAGQLNSSIKWLSLNKKMIVSLYFNDILRSNLITYTTFSNNIKNSFRNYYDERFFRIGLVYNFGKKLNTENRDGKNQEDQDRVN